MELTFVVKIIIGYDSMNCTKKCFSFDYDPTTQDYEEFAKKCGWDNAYDLLTSDLDETDVCIKEDIRNDLKEDFCYCLDTYLDKHSLDLFKDFLTSKYQDKVEEFLLANITCDSSYDLNDILNYY